VSQQSTSTSEHFLRTPLHFMATDLSQQPT